MARRLAVLAAICAILAPALAVAHEEGEAGHHDRPLVLKPWARATPPGADTGAVYFRLVNQTAREITLTGARTAVAAEVMLHKTISGEGGGKGMRKIDELAVPAGETAVFAPGKRHVMLIGLKEPLEEGERFRLKLDFAQAATWTVPVRVAGIGARTAPQSN